MAIALALLLWIGRGTGFVYDEWYFWARYYPVTLGNLLEPGNGNLVLLPVALYKVVIAIAGVAYVPYRVVEALSVVAVAVLFYFTTRAGDPRRAWIALGPAILLAYFGTSWDAVDTPLGIPSLFGLIFGLAAMITVERNTVRGDLATLGLLTAGLASFTTAVPFVIAVAVVMCFDGGRSRWRRLTVPGVLLVAYAFYRWNYGDYRTIDGKKLTADHLLHAPNHMLESAKFAVSSLVGLYPLHLTGRTPIVLVAVLLGLLVCVIALRLLIRPAVNRRAYAYAAGLLVLWLSLAALDKGAGDTRYQYPTVILLMALLIELAAGVRLPIWAKAAVAAMLAFSLAVNTRQLIREHDFLVTNNELNRAKMAGLEIIADRVPRGITLQRLALPEEEVYADIYVIDAGDYLSAIERDGSPAMSAAELARGSEEQRDAADRLMFNGLLMPQRAAQARLGKCLPARRAGDVWMAVTGPISASPAGFGIGAGAAQVTVRMRRYGDRYSAYPLEFPAESSAWLEIPGDRSRVPWKASLRSPEPFELCAARG
jgi:hypothetical protein